MPTVAQHKRENIRLFALQEMDKLDTTFRDQPAELRFEFIEAFRSLFEDLLWDWRSTTATQSTRGELTR